MRQQFATAQFGQCLTIGFRFRRAIRERLRVVVVEILRQFLNDGGFARRLKLQALQPPSDLWFPVRHVCFSFSASLLDAGGDHSLRSATSGSTRVARSAGIQHASSATSVSDNVITTNVNGSVALTPKSSVFIKRVSASAPPNPSSAPPPASFIPCPMTSFSTSPACAPKAIRTPNSLVRLTTLSDITPYMPISASNKAVVANPASSRLVTRFVVSV